MAAVNTSPSGFSYAQAAKGRASTATSQATSSKGPSGAVTPATGTFSELAPSSNWADDVEASVGDKHGKAQNVPQENGTRSESKESAVERVKMEEKVHNSTSGVSSPDLAASSSTTTKEDDSSSAPNGSSSETTWETKSQASEPAWIAEREKRQNSSQVSESTATADKQSEDREAASPPPSTPVLLQEAPPPMVNPWQKRAEEAKAKMAAMPKPAPVIQTSDTSVLKENQRPRADSRKKSNSIASMPRESLTAAGDDSRKPNGFQGKRANDVRNNGFRQNSKAAGEESRSDATTGASSRAAVTREHQSLPNMSIPPPSVKDEVSWPTPDTAQEKDRKDVSDKDAETKQDDDTTPTTKRKKQEWKVIPVVPTVIWETQSMNEPKDRKSRGPSNGDRGGRNGNGYRGRGGYRGAPNGTNGGDRQASQTSSSPKFQDSDVPATTRGRSNTADGEAMPPPPPRPHRASSTGTRREQQSDALPGRNTNGEDFATDRSSEGTTLDTAKPAAPTNGIAKPFSDSRRTKSPKDIDAASSEQRDDEIVATPIPRRNSVATQTEKYAEGTENANQDVPPIRMVPSESRREPRSFDNFREPSWNGSTRGSKRGGRGRGGGNGVRELPNGHPAGHAYGNSYPADLDTAPVFGAVPPSPSSFQPGRGNHQFTYPPPGRGGWARGNTRSQSIPVDHSYLNRFAAAQYSNPQQLAPLQTYAQGMYELNGYPMTAMMYPPQGDLRYLIDMVNTQIEYYFSMENLIKDTFLRKHMDSQGYVFLDVIANFRRLQSLTQDKDIIKYVCIDSQLIEIRVGEDGKERLRRREGWEQFVLPMAEREQSAQNEGPKHLERPERPQLSFGNAPSPYRGPASAGVPGAPARFDRRAYDSVYPMMNGYTAPFSQPTGIPEGMYGDMTNGEEVRGRAEKSPIHDKSLSPSKQSFAGVMDSNDMEQDAFPDYQVSMLTVVVKTNEPTKAPFHSAASRTFSNGSIDLRSILAEIQQPSEATSLTDRTTLTNGTTKTPSLSRHASSSNVHSSGRGAAANTDLAFFWMKNVEKPVDALPPDAKGEPYVQLRHRALDQRNHAATGTCPYDLDVLYQFWCHFLLRNFNNRMYTEFRHLAHEDARERHNATGLQNLLMYFSHSLLSQTDPIREQVCRDYVELVKSEPAALEGAAFRQLRSAWRNGALNLRSRKMLADMTDAKLKERLDRTTEG